jgi:predicted amidohydrolase
LAEISILLSFLPAQIAANVEITLSKDLVMKIMICEFPDEAARKANAWGALAEHVALEKPDVAVLPEMPFCEWIFIGEAVDPALWRKAMMDHDRMIEKFDDLACPMVMSSRPVERDGRRFNEAFVWSKAARYQAVRRKWYLPDLPVARETTWFEQGDRDFSPMACGSLRVGFQLCSEIMFPEHAREIGFADAHLIAHPRASGGGRRWQAACEMSAVTSGCYVASANRRSYDRDGFSGGSWLFSPDAAMLGETTAERPFVTVEIETAVAERAKTTYPRDMQQIYCSPATRQEKEK